MMTEKEIHDICKIHNITNYTINPDGSIDVDGSVDLFSKDINKLPIKFNIINGNVIYSFNNLTSLENFPNEIIGDLYLGYNNINNFIGIPKVSGHIYCNNNPLTSLEGYSGDYDKLIFDYNLKNKLIRKTKLKILNDLYND